MLKSNILTKMIVMQYKIGNKKFNCPLILTLDAIGGKWKGVIIWFLLESKVLRFSELKSKINEATKITDKMLIQCLRELEENQIIQRKVYRVVPPKVEYFLTQKGLKLKSVFDGLISFGLNFQEV